MTGVAHMPDVQKFFIKVRKVLKTDLYGREVGPDFCDPKATFNFL
jgi:hypothetical protein